jgi:hypothetical protein
MCTVLDSVHAVYMCNTATRSYTDMYASSRMHARCLCIHLTVML